MRFSGIITTLALGAGALSGCGESKREPAREKEVLVPDHLEQATNEGRVHRKRDGRKHNRKRNGNRSADEDEEVKSTTDSSKSKGFTHGRKSIRIKSEEVPKKGGKSTPAIPKVQLFEKNRAIMYVSDRDEDKSTVMVKRATVDGKEKVVAIKYMRNGDCAKGSVSPLEAQYETLLRVVNAKLEFSVAPILLNGDLKTGPFTADCVGRALVMEYGGVSVRQVVKEHNQVLDMVDLVNIALHLVRMIKAMHKVNVVHGSINWSHVLLRNPGVRLVGWSKAKLGGEATIDDYAYEVRSICYLLLQAKKDEEQLNSLLLNGMNLSQIERCFPVLDGPDLSLADRLKVGSVNANAKQFLKLLKENSGDRNYDKLEALLTEMRNDLGTLFGPKSWDNRSFVSATSAAFSKSFKSSIAKNRLLEVIDAYASVAVNTGVEILPYNQKELNVATGYSIFPVANRLNERTVTVKLSDTERYVVRYGSSCHTMSVESQTANSVRMQHAYGSAIASALGKENGFRVIYPTDFLPGDLMNAGSWGQIVEQDEDVPLVKKELVLSSSTRKRHDAYYCSNKVLNAIVTSITPASVFLVSSTREVKESAPQIFVQLLRTLEALHEKGFVYNAIDGDSLLSFENKGFNPVQLVDFSQARHILNSKYSGEEHYESPRPNEHELNAYQVFPKFSSPFELENLDRNASPSSFRDDVYKAFELFISHIVGGNIFITKLREALRNEQKKCIPGEMNLATPPKSCDDFVLIADIKRDLVSHVFGTGDDSELTTPGLRKILIDIHGGIMKLTNSAAKPHYSSFIKLVEEYELNRKKLAKKSWR